MQALVVDESLRAVPPGSEGELIMTGPQLTLGYWQDPERTAAAFIIPSGTDTVYYRTGDRVRRSTDAGPLVYIGRLDQQIKVNGYRVELGEVEAILREEAGADVAVALGWPLTPSGAGGIAAFLGKVNADTEEIRTRLKARLPNYMVPHELRVLSEFPLNANGKVDRKALFKLLEETSL
jgi:acyl-CoA synthetase (AMP-forming)/AMP-acid ligase II